MVQLTPIQTFMMNFATNHKIGSIIILVAFVTFFLLLENWKDWFSKKNKGVK